MIVEIIFSYDEASSWDEADAEYFASQFYYKQVKDYWQ